jgi:hypothetical protein
MKKNKGQKYFLEGDFMSLKKVGALLLLLGLMGCHGASDSPQSANDLPVIGLGEDGKAIVRYIPKGRHLKHMTGLMSEISEKSTKSLDRFEFDEGFKLTRVSVGLEVVFEFGILDIMVMELKPSVDLRFEPLPNPNQV